MSYTKVAFNNNILKPLGKIQSDTLKDNDFTDILEHLNAMMIVGESITKHHTCIGQLWNEIVSDILASLTLASSGHYRSAIVILRSVLELGCNSFFYYDHLIEFQMFQHEDMKADKYVSTLVNEYNFFTTKYIKTFFSDIENCQQDLNSVSNFLKKLYGELSDILHGRYKKLSKVNGLKVKYDKVLFLKYQEHYFSVMSILAVMYILRFGDKKDTSILALANKSRVVSI